MITPILYMTVHQWRELKSRFGDRSYRMLHRISPNEIVISLYPLLFERNGIAINSGYFRRFINVAEVAGAHSACTPAIKLS